MNKIETFQQFLETQGLEIAIWGFLLNLILAGVLGYILGQVYVRYGLAISNRKMFAKNFVVMAMTTMFIISIVKSSLALSLGLVGALSIVRFRAAIKEPEELVYLFITISIGLGLGADQTLTTISAFIVIVIAIWFKSKGHKKEEVQNLHLSVSGSESDKINVDKVIEILERFCSAVSLKRFDEDKEMVEVSFIVEIDNFENLKQIRSELQAENEAIKITFLDTKSMMSY